MSGDRLEILLDNAAITAKVAEIARAIERDHPDEPPLLVGILKGSIHFLSDLARHLKLDCPLEFMQARSYEGAATTGFVQIKRDLEVDIAGRHVVLVEDIVDTGLTIARLREILLARRPASLKVAALLEKPDARQKEVPLEYVGFSIPNEFVVGYGLDHDERYRNLPYIAILRPENP